MSWWCAQVHSGRRSRSGEGCQPQSSLCRVLTLWTPQQGPGDLAPASQPGTGMTPWTSSRVDVGGPQEHWWCPPPLLLFSTHQNIFRHLGLLIEYFEFTPEAYCSILNVRHLARLWTLHRGNFFSARRRICACLQNWCWLCQTGLWVEKKGISSIFSVFHSFILTHLL